MAELILHGYCRSSAVYRVRIALNLKGLAYEQHIVNLLNDDHHSQQYRSKNPQGLVPLLEHQTTDETRFINQSLAIIEYLNEAFSGPELLPEEHHARAQARAFALSICCDIHPLNNLRVLKYLKQELNSDDEQRNSWYQHWIHQGFSALEPQLNAENDFCFGSQPTLADICLVPQVFNALRFNCDISTYTNIQRIYQRCSQLPAFIQAAPEKQVDFKGAH